MIERDVASTAGAELAPSTVEGHDKPNPSPTPLDASPNRWRARNELAWHRAETERVKVLVEFLARPIHAHGGSDPDPDIVTAYNLAVEAALQGIRRATIGR